MTEKLIEIDITDYENITLDGELNITEIKGNGVLLVKNESEKSRLWNLNCDAKEVINTNVGEKNFSVGSLNPKEKFTKEYTIENLKEPCLNVVELFDTVNSE